LLSACPHITDYGDQASAGRAEQPPQELAYGSRTRTVTPADGAGGSRPPAGDGTLVVLDGLALVHDPPGSTVMVLPATWRALRTAVAVKLGYRCRSSGRCNPLGVRGRVRSSALSTAAVKSK
jgi:hypothetical protein